MRAPVQATGWPSEQPEPTWLVISSSRPSSRAEATAIDENASLISMASMSSMPMPASLSALGTASVGARPLRSTVSATEAHERTIANGVRPWLSANSRLHSTIAAAASLRPELLPGVTIAPSSIGLITGSEASFSSEEVRRGCSSTLNSAPSPSGTLTSSASK